MGAQSGGQAKGSKKPIRLILSLLALFMLSFSAFPLSQGAASAQGPTVPSGILAYVPITITNSQSSPTPAPFQQMVIVDSATYSSYEASNLQNVEFFGADGSVIPSWLESGNSNSATATVYWLNIAAGILADSSVAVYMGFASPSTNLFNAQSTGEAPELSPIYAQYDDGAQVFPVLYDNFVGSSLSGIWAAPSTSGATYSVNNGVTLTLQPGGGEATLITKSTVAGATSPIVAETYVTSSSCTCLAEIIAQTINSNGGDGRGNTAYQAYTDYGTSAYFVASHGSGVLASNSTAVTYPVQIGLYWGSTGNEMASFQDSTGLWTASSTDSSITIAAKYVSIELANGETVSSPSSAVYQWVRARNAPPNDVMPTVTLSALVSSTITLPSGILAYVPITITNSQSSPTPAPFQQMVQVDSAKYSSYEASNLQNLEFFDFTGSVIPSWLESGNSNTATNTTYWLNIAAGIPAGSSVMVYLGFASTSTNLLNSLATGEAPQLSPTYGQFDDGNSVFTFYDNFRGNTLDSSLWTSMPGSSSIIVNNGLTITGNSYAQIYTTAAFSMESSVFESYGYCSASGSTCVPVAGQTGAGINPAYYIQAYGCSFYCIHNHYNGDAFDAIGSSGSFSSDQVLSVWQSSSATIAELNYGSETTFSSQFAPLTSGNLGIEIQSSGSSVATVVTWTRIRAIPPNGVMPTATPGSLVASTTSVSCTPSPVVVESSTTCTATVMGIRASPPTGTVTWSSSGTGAFTPSYATCVLSSGACSVSYTPSSATPSPVSITASYGGDSNNSASSGSFSLAVVKTTTSTSVSCSPSSVTGGSASTCTATVTGNSPTGTVTWASSGVANFTPAPTCTLSGGACSVSYTAPSSATSVMITATYGGDSYNAASSGTFTISVTPTSTSTTSFSSTTPTTSASITTTSSSTSVTTPIVSSTPTTTSTTTSSTSSAIPEFPFQAVAAFLLVLVVLASYVAARKRIDKGAKDRPLRKKNAA